MKIAVWHNLPSGGGKRALYYFVRGLVERGHELTCWSLDSADRAYLPLSDLAPERIVSSDFKRSSRKSLSERWRPDFNHSLDQMRSFDRACQLCAREIESGGFDVLFANTAIHYGVPYVLGHLKMKKVLYLQEPCRFLYEASPLLPWVVGAPEDLAQAGLIRARRFISDYAMLQTLRIQAKQEWLNVANCDRVLVNSYFSRESVLRAYGVDARVCYLGIDSELFRNLKLPRERFVVGLGSFDSIKGIDLAIRAVALLGEPRPPLVWIANSGNKEYIKAMTELALSVAVELRVELAVSDSELVTILNRASLLLYTSRLEPFGFAPLEANSCGLPVVGIAEGGIRETVRDGVNGFLVDPRAEDIARAADNLLRDPELARRIGEQAAMYVRQNWSLKDSIDRLETMLFEVVAGKEKTLQATAY